MYEESKTYTLLGTELNIIHNAILEERSKTDVLKEQLEDSYEEAKKLHKVNKELQTDLMSAAFATSKAEALNATLLRRETERTGTEMSTAGTITILKEQLAIAQVNYKQILTLLKQSMGENPKPGTINRYA